MFKYITQNLLVESFAQTVQLKMDKWQVFLLFFCATQRRQDYIFEFIKLTQITGDWSLLKHRFVSLGTSRRDELHQPVTPKQKVYF